MKNSNLGLFPILAILIGFAFTVPHTTFNALPKWEKLGQRAVDRKVDHDEILVTAREGRFTAIKLIVRRSAINMHRCIVQYANGDREEIELRQNIPAGGQSRVIDLAGNKRIIHKVVLRYDTKGLQDKAIVELWGRH